MNTSEIAERCTRRRGTVCSKHTARSVIRAVTPRHASRINAPMPAFRYLFAKCLPGGFVQTGSLTAGVGCAYGCTEILLNITSGAARWILFHLAGPGSRFRRYAWGLPT